MQTSGPVRRGNALSWASQCVALSTALVVLSLTSFVARAQDGTLRLEAIDVQPLAGQQVELRLQLSGTAPEPMTFTIDDPARISLDLPNTSIGLDSGRRDVNVGPLTTILTAEANGTGMATGSRIGSDGSSSSC